MHSIFWTPAAQGHVQRVFRFLSPKSPRAAVRALDTIQRAVLKLRRFPEAGRPIPELGPAFRELLVPFGDGGYVVLYFFAGGDIEILSVKHQREAGY